MARTRTESDAPVVFLPMASHVVADAGNDSEVTRRVLSGKLLTPPPVTEYPAGQVAVATKFTFFLTTLLGPSTMVVSSAVGVGAAKYPTTSATTWTRRFAYMEKSATSPIVWREMISLPVLRPIE